MRAVVSDAHSLASLDATATAALVRSKAVSPRELVEQAIARIERTNAELGAITVPLFDEARAAAENPPPGPFRGVPIVVKDLGAPMRGAVQTGGLRPLRSAGIRDDHDSYLIERLRAAGFIIIARTNTSELGILPAAEPLGWPATKNPYDLTRSPGGSSGGSACAVAAGLVPIAHASDGGGSIRIPASCCGLFGLKPTRARSSLGPDAGDINGGLVNEHVVARSVRDSAAVLDLIAGMRLGDPYCAPPQSARYIDELVPPSKPLRIGFATRYPTPAGTLAESHPTCAAAVAHTAKLLADHGHHVEPVEIAALHDPEWAPRFIAVWAVGVATKLNEVSRVLRRPIESHELQPLTAALGELGRLISGTGYAEAWRWLHRSTRRIAEYWERYDLWLTPTVTEPPVALGKFASPPDDPLIGIMRAAEFAPFTAPFNATGQPAVSLPLYRDASGLPIGTQLVAAHGREDLLFRVSAQLEAAQPFVHAATRIS
ncbi:MAG: amidase [Kofleriaceae bacterium]